MVGADDDDLLIDQLGQPSDLQRDLAQESLSHGEAAEAAHGNETSS